MADRIADELLRFTATSSFRPHDDEVRAIAVELLAARARITKLEQEPPMAMIDFGVGVNWKGLSEDRQRLRAERDLARAEVDRLLRLMPPTARGITNGPGEGSWSVFAEKVVAERDAARAEVERLNGLLPLLMKLWDAAKEAAGTISMSQEHSCYHTYGFLDKEPALKMIDALEELRLWKNKETS